MKKLLIPLLLLASAYGDLIDEKVRSLVDPNSYLQHQRLIEILFREKREFHIDENRIDSVKIVTTLKENGLLDIFYNGEPKEIKATFRTIKNQNFFLKAVKDSLTDLGYNFTIVSSVKKEKLFFEWTITYRSDHAIDPALLFKRISNYGINIDDISKTKDDWFYLLSASNIVLPEATSLTLNNPSAKLLLVPSGEYWVEIPENTQKITIKRRTGAIWFPYIAFYDQDFKILSVVAYNEAKRSISIKGSHGSKYMKITDNYTTENLKHGILLWAEGEQ